MAAAPDLADFVHAVGELIAAILDMIIAACRGR